MLGREPRNRVAGLSVFASFVLFGVLLVGSVQGERTQHGTLIVSLGGRLSPLALPRERLAPVAVHLDGRLQTADGSSLPQVTRVELGLPQQGVLSTHGLPTCTKQRLQATRSVDALAACRPALVGRGRVDVTVQLPAQQPYTAHLSLLAFNARIEHKPGVLLHVYTPEPPFAVVFAFTIRRRSGRFGTALAADLPAFSRWARVAQFEMTLSRRYSYRDHRYSYLSASCPIPKRFTAGFFSFARVAYTLANGSQVSTAIARSCRAR
jgi:hypothetical protein